jgi:hypothetical protein
MLQHRHLRRLAWELIKLRVRRKELENQIRKSDRRNIQNEEGRRAFNVNSRRKSQAKKTEFQTGGFSGLSFRR